MIYFETVFGFVGGGGGGRGEGGSPLLLPKIHKTYPTTMNLRKLCAVAKEDPKNILMKFFQ